SAMLISDVTSARVSVSVMIAFRGRSLDFTSRPHRERLREEHGDDDEDETARDDAVFEHTGGVHHEETDAAGSDDAETRRAAKIRVELMKGVGRQRRGDLPERGGEEDLGGSRARGADRLLHAHVDLLEGV